MKKYKIVPIICLVNFCILFSCTNLDETVYSEILKDNFYKSEAEIISALAPAYGGLRGIESLWEAAALATDEAVIPTRGKDWYDGGIYLRLHEHNWQPQLSYFSQIWSYGYGRVNKANQLIYQLAQVEDKMDPAFYAQFVAELKIIRAFGYYQLIDHFGNVPIVDRFDVPPGFLPKNNADFQAGRTEVFNFIEKDIVDNVNFLSSAKDQSTYGRFNKYAALALLAKLYINAETWTGTPRWNEAIVACDSIIQSGKYTLESDYFANFLGKNENSKENIFVIPYDGLKTDWEFITYWTSLHPSLRKKYNTTNGPWNGMCAIPSHVKSFPSGDKRRNGWLTGLQYSSTGELLKCAYESVPNPLNLTVDFTNIYNPSDPAVYNHVNALEYHGARFVKYEITPYPSWSMENDRVVYRLGDIMLLKAEALMRKNGGAATQEAVDLVNAVRSRAFADPASNQYNVGSLTLSALLQERSWELYFECVRRNDLVRFGKFVRGTWEFFDRSAEGDYRNVYPIPQDQINSNPSLIQNPGY
jgi:starch-binding outer membrane protein, SusD/RagB family